MKVVSVDPQRTERSHRHPAPHRTAPHRGCSPEQQRIRTTSIANCARIAESVRCDGTRSERRSHAATTHAHRRKRQAIDSWGRRRRSGRRSDGNAGESTQPVRTWREQGVDACEPVGSGGAIRFDERLVALKCLDAEPDVSSCNARAQRSPRLVARGRVPP